MLSYLEKTAGKALGGQLIIKSYNLGEKQTLAEGISFVADDGSMSFEVEQARIRYDLFKFIFSGFKIKHILQDVEVMRPYLRLKIIPSEEKKPSKPFEIPDLSAYFKQIAVTDGRLELDLSVALKLGDGEILHIFETLNGIQINAKSDEKVHLDLSAISGKGGKISAQGVLDKTLLEALSLQVTSLVPSHIHHQALGNPSTELNLEASVRQDPHSKEFSFAGKALLWNTTALLLDTYPISLPFLSANLDSDRLQVSLSTAQVGNSRIGGQIAINKPLKKPSLGESAVNLRLDLAMIDSSLSGIVNASLSAQGKFLSPKAEFSASSDWIKVAGQQISSIRIKGNYQDEVIGFESLDATWMDHQIKARGSFDPFALALNATLQGQALPSAREIALNLDADLNLALYQSLPEVQANFRSLSVRRNGYAIQNLQGHVNLYPALDEGHNSYLADCELAAPDGQYLNLVGDVIDQSLAINTRLNTIPLAEIYPHELLAKFTPTVRGSIDGFIHQGNIVAQTDIFLALSGDIDYSGTIRGTGSYGLSSGNGGVFLNTSGGRFNGKDLDFDLAASIKDKLISISSFRLEDLIQLTGTLPIENPLDASLKISINDLSTSTIMQYIKDLDIGIPEIRHLNLVGSYNLEGDRLLAFEMSAGPVELEPLKPLSATVSLRGPPGNITLQGKAHSGSKELGLLDGRIDLEKGFLIDLNGQVASAPISDVVKDLPLETSLTGDLRFAYGTPASTMPGMLLGAKVSSPKLVIPDVIELEDLWLDAIQTPELLTVDSLRVSSKGVASLHGSGALDYNIISGNYFDGNSRLKVSAEGELFSWLKENIDYIIDSRGRSYLSCEIGTSEEQFMISKGNIDIRDGFLQLKDQVEPIIAINMAASILDNRVSIDRGSLSMGRGKLKFFSEFDEDDSENHFHVGFLDLGYLKLGIEEPGIKANIPYFTAPRTLSNVVLKGRDSPYLTVLGPFDDIRIKGDVYIADAQALYPPNTDNLLNLVYSFRGVLSKPEPEKEETELAPLPFKLDIIIHLMDNIRYVTYPVKLEMMPGGLLHLTYDGQDFSAKEARFSSEKGQIDFLGTVFQAEKLNLSILETQDLFLIEGTFIKRSDDGTIITLRVSTDRDTSKPVFDRLEFNLSSDNPQDRSIGDILTKLRYSGSSGKLSDDPQNLQDEALSLISDNLNTQILSPMFYPLENQIRRALGLDGFSINTGFIQNLFTQYSNDPETLSQYMDLQHLMDDITKFSSTILLNNLSINASKYLGRKIYLDYKLGLQEATDLQKKTSILVSHDISLLMYLPKQFKLGYTFKYEPQEELFTHGLMLQKAFRFWGI